MLELAAHLLPVLRAGEPAAVVTVSRVSRSAPRGAGAAMAVLRDGRIVGSISGGCVEGDAVLLASGVLARGGVARATLGFSDDDAHAAGLACGGSVEVVVHRVEPGDGIARDALEQAAAGRSARIGVVLEGPDAGRTVPIGSAGETRVERDTLVVVHDARPRLVIVGAGEHAMALCRVASAAGWSVAVTDVWERLVTADRFPGAERREVGDPAALLPDLVGGEPRTAAVCVLTHDERVDVPAIAAALALGAGFVGAMGARGTVAHRRRLLDAAGVAPSDIARLRSPLGLDLGGSSPEETALSVLAEIVAARRGGSGRPLRERSGPVHRRAAATDAGIRLASTPDGIVDPSTPDDARLAASCAPIGVPR